MGELYLFPTCNVISIDKFCNFALDIDIDRYIDSDIDIDIDRCIDI